MIPSFNPNNNNGNSSNPLFYFPHSSVSNPPAFLPVSPQTSVTFKYGQDRPDGLLNRLIQTQRMQPANELTKVVPESIPLLLYTLNQQQQALAALQQQYQSHIMAQINPISIDTATPLARSFHFDFSKLSSITASPMGNGQMVQPMRATRRVRKDGFKIACNWCSKQRSRCVMSADGKTCERCQKRGSPCVFSLAKKRGRPCLKGNKDATKRQRVDSSEDEREESEGACVSPNGVEETILSL